MGNITSVMCLSVYHPRIDHLSVEHQFFSAFDKIEFSKMETHSADSV